MSRNSILQAVANTAMTLLLSIAVTSTITYAYSKYTKHNKVNKHKISKVLDKLGLKNLQLSEYEQIIASEVVFSEDIDVSFKDIGGLDTVILNLRETVMFPLCHNRLYSKLVSLPKGVLLYGAPGCGKTMLAKAIARESGATFINLHISTLMDKWFGESQKLVSAVFSLAKKLQPSIIFVDEIDCFLRERSKSDHEATGMMKAEFMTLWDGLDTDATVQIIVLGATNRPNDLDQAILRRMPKRFHITSPDLEQRQKVLELLLKDEVLEVGLSIRELARLTAGYSNSDLKEMCRNAAFIPIQEIIRENTHDLENLDLSKITKRPLKNGDFFSTEAHSGSIYGIDGSLTGKLDLD